jgi:hypothetical protein
MCTGDDEIKALDTLRLFHPNIQVQPSAARRSMSTATNFVTARDNRQS